MVVLNLLILAIILSSVIVVINRSLYGAISMLILTYFCAAWFFVFLNAEFITYVLLIVYLGAVIVLFLFASMICPPARKVRPKYWVFLPLVSFFALIFYNIIPARPIVRGWSKLMHLDNLQRIAFELYFYNMPVLYLSGILLLVAILGIVALYRYK